MKNMSEKASPKTKRKPKFWIDFVGFADYGSMIEATLALSPEFDVSHIVDFQYSLDSARTITLVFTRKNQKIGRRGYSLKQEWEQIPDDKGKERSDRK